MENNKSDFSKCKCMDDVKRAFEVMLNDALVSNNSEYVMVNLSAFNKLEKTIYKKKEKKNVINEK